MLVTASALSSFQRCPRQYIFSVTKPEERRWRPRSLFVRVLRAAVERISAVDLPIDKIRDLAVAEFLEQAAKPGLAVSGNPFQLASDYASILKTAITAIQASVPLSLKTAPSIVLSPDVTWSSRVLVDSAHMLHSWVAVDYWNDGVLARELHSWHVLGEIACTGLPMTLWVLEVGRQSGSHQITPWCRIYRHPLLVGRFAFQSKTGKPLGPNWKPVFFSESRKNDPDNWVDMMNRDGVNLFHRAPVRAIAPSQRQPIMVDICVEAARMKKTWGSAWQDEPLRRTSCDVPPCAWQDVCYGKRELSEHALVTMDR